jgi:hypothetical protein
MVLDPQQRHHDMVLPDHARERDLNERHRLWPFIETRAAEVGLTGSDAVNRLSRPSALGHQREQESERPDPEAGQ